MLRSSAIAVVLLVVLTAALCSGQQITEVPPSSAAEHLVKKVDPVYPPLAKAARLQGTVTLKVVISKEGNVTDVKTVSGSPILLSAATSAVKQWQYKPFMVEGTAAEVSTVVEVPFSLGISETDYKKEHEVSDRYFKQEEKCRRLWKNCERKLNTSLQMVHLAFLRLLLRRS